VVRSINCLGKSINFVVAGWAGVNFKELI